MKLLQPSPQLQAITLALSPVGHVYLQVTDQDTEEHLSAITDEKIRGFFANGGAVGLLRLGLVNFSEPLPTAFAFWQQFSQRFIAEICKLSGLAEKTDQLFPSPPSLHELREIMVKAPFMIGVEYLNPDVLTQLWHDLHTALKQELTAFSDNLQTYLSAYHANWNLIGRVCFHLAENKENIELPFAFLATYTTSLSSAAKVQHLPLGKALQEYSGEKNKSVLLTLLLPVQKAAAQSIMIKELVANGDIFQPQAWTANEAHRFLKDIPLYEAAGIVVRVPNWWNAKKPPRPQVSIAIGKNSTTVLGMNALLDFDLQFALANGEKLTAQEWEKILATTENFIKIKGQWVEVDRDKLQQVLSHWKKVQQQVRQEGLTFAKGMRLLAGAATIVGSSDDKIIHAQTAEWSTVIAGDWLKELLQNLHSPEQAADKTLLPILKKHLHANLRPYQMAGVQWLWLLYRLKLGGCLADDMGLGKTIQIIALLLLIKYQQPSLRQQPHLLIIPASLLGNWQTEIARFAPDLKVWIAHSSVNNDADLKQLDVTRLVDIDLVITTYAFVYRLPNLAQLSWGVLILDEAQLIKNPNARQTRAIKALQSQVRFTLTGTPIENRLSDLWSLFDFTAPGLLGSSKAFSNYSKKTTKTDSQSNSQFYAAIRTLVSPYILRRLKSDKRVIADLPDKTEVSAYCALSKQQIGLYQQTVSELQQQLESADGMQRRGLVLAYLLRLKQICNHPVQWLGHGDYHSEASGKFLRIQEICQEIAAKQEKVLVFTQFREIMPALAEFLGNIFGREGLVLHGATAIKQRAKLVELFQQEQGPPFFVLSLKAGGTGLNLTNAAHVIHFDRWWNPAVENQATDRAYRIGQKKNVLVHKFICRGTIEEKIDELLTAKKSLSNEILASGDEILLTELGDEELIKIVSLDIHCALSETI